MRTACSGGIAGEASQLDVPDRKQTVWFSGTVTAAAAVVVAPGAITERTLRKSRHVGSVGMGRLAVMGGHSLLGSGWMHDAPVVEVETEHRPITLHDTGEVVVLQRHGLDRFTNATSLDHRAHVRAVEAAGCDRILGLASAGSLRSDLGVGTFVAPDDFIALHLGLSFFDDARGHQIPGFDPEWRRRIVDTWERETDVPLVDGGVYWQAIGPRFETCAEIRLIAQHADLIGMTIAAECVLAKELGIPYAGVCLVDNLANGLGEATLSVEDFAKGSLDNRARLVRALDAVIPELAR